MRLEAFKLRVGISGECSKRDRAIEGGAISRRDFLVQTSVGSLLGGVTWGIGRAICLLGRRDYSSKAKFRLRGQGREGKPERLKMQLQ